MKLGAYLNQNQAVSAKQQFVATYGKVLGVNKQGMNFSKIFDMLSVSEEGQETQKKEDGLRNLTKAEAQYLKGKYQSQLTAIKQKQLEALKRAESQESPQAELLSFETQKWEVQASFIKELKDMGVLNEEECSVLSDSSMPILFSSDVQFCTKEDDPLIIAFGTPPQEPEYNFSTYDQDDPTSYYRFMLHLCKSGKYGFDTPEWQAKIPIYEKGIKLVSNVFG